ncbi:MAG: fused MFS/spermidine synthase [Sandaracinaceae bacterium]|nr:fused MFS/spermidine synthase [Sandaracinaceae bacterium]
MKRTDFEPLEPSIHIDPQSGRKEMLIDGAPSSVFQPEQPVTGDVWDALACPVAMFAHLKTPRVLILGLGGGTIARVIRAFSPKAYIAAVEISPAVIDAAREHFDLDSLHVDVTRADAQDFLSAPPSEFFDVIIEDIFLGAGRDVRKPSWLPEPGYTHAQRWLTPTGIFVANTVNESQGARIMCEFLYQYVVAMRIDFAHNTVFAASNNALDAIALQNALAGSEVWSKVRERISIMDIKQHA